MDRAWWASPVTQANNHAVYEPRAEGLRHEAQIRRSGGPCDIQRETADEGRAYRRG
jgi:hypothetical protein